MNDTDDGYHVARADVQDDPFQLNNLADARRQDAKQTLSAGQKAISPWEVKTYLGVH